MTNKTILRLTLYISTIFLSYHVLAQKQEKEIISDSLSQVLKEPACDSLQMADLFQNIKKNRKKLKDNYIPLLHKYAKAAKKNSYQKGLMEAYDRIGLQYRFDHLFDSSIYYHELSLELAIRYNNYKQQYYNYNNLGQVYRIQDLNIEAIAYYHKALDISELLKDEKSSSYTMNSLGAAYVVQKDPKKAMTYYQKSAQIAKRRNDTRTMGHNYSSIGQLYLDAGILDSAMFYLELAKTILIEAKWHGSIALTNSFIAQIQYELGNYEESEVTFNQALPELIKTRKTRYQSLTYIYLGKIKLHQNKTDSAIYYLDMAKGMAIETHSFQNLQRIYQAYFELYKKEQQWEKAIEALEQTYAYNDSIISLTNVRVLQNLEVAYQSKQKEQQIKLLSTENKLKTQRIRLGTILLIAFFISIVLGIYMQQLRRKQTSYEQDKLKQKLMLSQMNPHFIFNALGSIQSFMYRNEAKKAAAYLGNFASLSRSILQYSTEEKIALDEEIKTLENYLELEKMRMQDGFEYRFIFINEVDTEFIQIPPMMLQPFVENSIKHGLHNINYPGEINITIKDEESYLKIEIIDNGIGIEASAKVKKVHQSKATEIFKQRMNIIKRQFKNIPPLMIEDLHAKNEQGTKVTIYLPIYEA